MKQNTRMAIYLDFCETTSVLFSTDVASRGLDFPAVDWVIQVRNNFLNIFISHFCKLIPYPIICPHDVGWLPRRCCSLHSSSWSNRPFYFWGKFSIVLLAIRKGNADKITVSSAENTDTAKKGEFFLGFLQKKKKTFNSCVYNLTSFSIFF